MMSKLSFLRVLVLLILFLQCLQGLESINKGSTSTYCDISVNPEKLAKLLQRAIIEANALFSQANDSIEGSNSCIPISIGSGGEEHKLFSLFSHLQLATLNFTSSLRCANLVNNTLPVEKLNSLGIWVRNFQELLLNLVSCIWYTLLLIKNLHFKI